MTKTSSPCAAVLGLLVLAGCAHAPDPVAGTRADAASPSASQDAGASTASSGAARAGVSPTARYEKVVVRSSASFDFDRDALKSEDGQRILSALAAAGTVTWQSVNAVGYTDSIGTPRYNQGLSERRARAVKDYLVSKGVASDLIMTAGRAASDPIASNASEEGRAQNRRTAIEFEGVKAAP